MKTNHINKIHKEFCIKFLVAKCLDECINAFLIYRLLLEETKTSY